MATVNNRVKIPVASVINGVDAGGIMTISISEGYDQVLESPIDGLALPAIDREIQFCRGTVVTQDWIHMVDLLTGTVGTYIFYEKKSGAATYIQHTITNPMIHSVSINQTKTGYITCSFSFECKAADETKGFADMHAFADAQAEPIYISAARGGYRVKTAAHGGSTSLYHVMNFSFAIQARLDKACNDSDKSYTAVDVEAIGMSVNGSIGHQDSEIDGVSSASKAQDLLAASAANLVLTVTQGGGATDKVITIANVIFGTSQRSTDASKSFTEMSSPFRISNDPATPLTLAGENKIITIADAA